MMNKAVFLDRDGVINYEENGYTYTIEKFELLPDVVATLQELKRRGYLLIIITNQSGIAKGVYRHEDVNLVHDYMNKLLAEHDIVLDDIWYAPGHESFSNSLMRKPGSMMVERACALHNVDPSQSFMIGDKERDLVAAAGAGVTGLFRINTNDSISFILEHAK